MIVNVYNTLKDYSFDPIEEQVTLELVKGSLILKKNKPKIEETDLIVIDYLF